MDNTSRGNKPDQADFDPRPAAVTFVTAEHFTLQGARSSTISDHAGDKRRWIRGSTASPFPGEEAGPH